MDVILAESFLRDFSQNEVLDVEEDNLPVAEFGLDHKFINILVQNLLAGALVAGE